MGWKAAVCNAISTPPHDFRNKVAYEPLAAINDALECTGARPRSSLLSAYIVSTRFGTGGHPDLLKRVGGAPSHVAVGVAQGLGQPGNGLGSGQPHFLQCVGGILAYIVVGVAEGFDRQRAPRRAQRSFRRRKPLTLRRFHDNRRKSPQQRNAWLSKQDSNQSMHFTCIAVNPQKALRKLDCT